MEAENARIARMRRIMLLCRSRRAPSPALSLCSLKSGKVVVVLAGRYAGRKAVIVKTFDNGADGKKFGHCLGACACVARGPASPGATVTCG